MITLEHVTERIKAARECLSDVRADLLNVSSMTDEEKENVYFKLIEADTNLADLYSVWRTNIWEIPALMNEFLEYARILSSNEATLSVLCNLTIKMSFRISDHPRLELKFNEFELELRERTNYKGNVLTGTSEELRDKIDIYKKNIEFADRGDFDKIIVLQRNTQDPFEWTEQWENIIDDVDKKTLEAFTGLNNFMGFCHAFWNERQRVLREYYNIDWKTPAEMNSNVCFD
ncbi:hypothetical protein [Bacteroides thetaiotaomicron]|uniref:hypothetical protein n=1 Tax=Bacteroides thetaiotaomicron TaxID=818 RepID=UPI004063203F